MKYIVIILITSFLVIGCLMGPTPCHEPGDLDMDCDIDYDDLARLIQTNLTN